MTGRLEGKCAIVTGGGRGASRAVCRAFAQEGAKLVVSGLPDDPVDLAVSEIKRDGGTAIGYFGDCAEPEDARECVQLAMKRFGRLDALVLNDRGAKLARETQDISAESIQRSMRNNVQSPAMLTHYALPQLQQFEGVVLATANESRLTGSGERTVYGGARAFMHAFINGIAIEQATRGVRANSVCPTWSHSEFGEDGGVASVDGSSASPEQIAAMYVFLASDEARSINGELLYADDERLGSVRLDTDDRRQLTDSADEHEDPVEADIEVVCSAVLERQNEPPRPRNGGTRDRSEPTHSANGNGNGNGHRKPTQHEIVRTRPMDAFSCITQQLTLGDEDDDG